MRQRETATHGQQRGRRQRGEGLAVNTDGIIICVSVVCEKASQHWEGGGWAGERKWEQSFWEDDIWHNLSLFPCHVFRVLVCFWGNCSGRGGVIWWKHRHQSPITCRRNSNKVVLSALSRALVKSYVIWCSKCTPSYHKCLGNSSQPSFPFHNTCHNLARLVLRSRSSSASGCLYSGYQSSLFIIKWRLEKSISYDLTSW